MFQPRSDHMTNGQAWNYMGCRKNIYRSTLHPVVLAGLRAEGVE